MSDIQPESEADKELIRLLMVQYQTLGNSIARKAAWRIAELSAPQPSSERAMAAIKHRVIQAAYRPSPMCRDCADRDGTCYDGTKCDPFEAALDTLRACAAACRSRAGRRDSHE